jgi:hypothetical protein
MKKRENKYLYWAGIFLGLSVLTKYIATILYIYFLGLIFLEYMTNKHTYQKITAAGYFKKAFLDYLILTISSIMTIFLFLPAAWSDLHVLLEVTLFSKPFLPIWPIFIGLTAAVSIDIIFWKSRVASAIFGYLSRFKTILVRLINFLFIFSILAVVANVYSGMKFFDFESILASPKSAHYFNGFIGMTLANFYSMIFGIAPIALLAVIYLASMSFKKENVLRQNFRWTFYLVAFILIYYISSSIDQVSATVRYQIIIYPLVFLLAGVGIYEFLNIKTVKKYFRWEYVYAILIIFSVYSLNYIKPFYFSYASDLLPKQYVLNLKDMGDGSFEAARYLNSLPEAQRMNIWTDKRGVCSFFVGGCHSGFDFDKSKIEFDYFVVSSGRESRTSKMTLARINGGNTTLFRLDKLYTNENCAYKVEIGGRPNNFVKVIRSDSL